LKYAQFIYAPDLDLGRVLSSDVVAEAEAEAEAEADVPEAVVFWWKRKRKKKEPEAEAPENMTLPLLFQSCCSNFGRFFSDFV
jgi:hypothetical protein